MVTLTFQPIGVHKQTIIFIHGRGDNAEDFSEGLSGFTCSDGLRLPEKLPNVKWVFPSAPQHYAATFDEWINQWFDIYSLTDPAKREELQVQGLKESINQIRAIIHREASIIGADQVMVAGISQGCATGLHALLSYTEPLGGFIGACGWAPFKSKLDEAASAATEEEKTKILTDFYKDKINIELDTQATYFTTLKTPMWLTYARGDDVVMPELSQQLIVTATALGFPVQSKAYNLYRHWFKEPESYDDIVDFATRVANTR